VNLDVTLVVSGSGENLTVVARELFSGRDELRENTA
jgi:hypothetical protein